MSTSESIDDLLEEDLCDVVSVGKWCTIVLDRYNAPIALFLLHSGHYKAFLNNFIDYTWCGCYNAHNRSTFLKTCCVGKRNSHTFFITMRSIEGALFWEKVENSYILSK